MTLQPPLRENLVGTLGVERNRFRPDATEAVDGFGSPEPMMSGAIDIRQQRASVAELLDTLRMYLWAEIRHIDRRINFVSGSPMTAAREQMQQRPVDPISPKAHFLLLPRGHAHDHVYGRSFRSGSAASLPPCCDVDFVPGGGKRTYPPVSSVSARMGVLSIDAHRDLRGLCIGPTCRSTHLWVAIRSDRSSPCHPSGADA